MSTRGVVMFQGSDVLIYKHGDGYPSALGAELEAFLEDWYSRPGATYDPEAMIPQFLRFVYERDWYQYQERTAREGPDSWQTPEQYRTRLLSEGWYVATEFPDDAEYTYVVQENRRVRYAWQGFGTMAEIEGALRRNPDIWTVLLVV